MENQVEEVKQEIVNKTVQIEEVALQRKSDKYVTYARELSSRGSSFWIAALGVILQAAHTSLLLYSTSAFNSEWQKIVVSLGLGLFLSASLMIFTLKHKAGNEKSEFTLNLFFWFEVFVGVFYYINKLVFSVHRETGEWPGLDNYIFLLIGLPFAYMAPYAIKQFAYVIESDKTLEYGSIDIIPKIEKVEELQESFDDELLEEKIRNSVNEILTSTTTYANLNQEDRELVENVDKKFEKLEEDTKLVLKQFNKKLSEIPVVDETKFIKKGEIIRMKSGSDVKSIQLEVPNDTNQQS